MRSINDCLSSFSVHKFENITIEYLPPNTTSKIQPCDQGVISILKKLYKRNLLRRLLAHEDLDVTQLPLLIDLHAVCEDLSAAWESVKSTSLKHCWKKIYKDEPVEVVEFVDLLSIAQQIPILAAYTEQELDDWLSEELGPVYDDDKIIEAVECEKDPLEIVFEEALDLDQSSSSSDTHNSTEVAVPVSVSTENFDQMHAWAEIQENCKPEWMTALKEMKEFAQQTKQI